VVAFWARLTFFAIYGQAYGIITFGPVGIKKISQGGTAAGDTFI